MFTRKKFKTQCGIIGARGMQHRLANTDPLIGPVQDRINEVLLSGENICRLIKLQAHENFEHRCRILWQIQSDGRIWLSICRLFLHIHCLILTSSHEMINYWIHS